MGRDHEQMANWLSFQKKQYPRNLQSINQFLLKHGLHTFAGVPERPAMQKHLSKMYSA